MKAKCKVESAKCKGQNEGTCASGDLSDHFALCTLHSALCSVPSWEARECH